VFFSSWRAAVVSRLLEQKPFALLGELKGMTDISVVFAIGLAVGFAVGYAVRAAISLRHHRAAMKRRYLL
jgi:hypothetical protein